MAVREDVHGTLWSEIRRCTACRSVSGLETVASKPMYVPLPPLSPQPAGLPVTYLLVGAEPSERWRGQAPASRREANAIIDRGYRNYTGNQQVMALTFSAREWLVKPGREAFAITDMAKCALGVGLAKGTRGLRYGTCMPRWLDREIALYRPRAVIAIGTVVRARLEDMGIAKRHGVRVEHVPHFSPSNRGHWKVAPDELIPWPLPNFDQYARETLATYHAGSQDMRILDATRTLLSLYRREFRRIAHYQATE